MLRAIIVYMASQPAEPLSEEQYLHLERQAETKSEFHNGQMCLGRRLAESRAPRQSHRAAPLMAICESRLPRLGYTLTPIAAWFAANYNIPAIRAT